jgi:hypothetical protein
MGWLSMAAGSGCGGPGGGLRLGTDGGLDGGTTSSFPIDPQRIFDDVAALASPAMQGRKPPSEGNLAALAYVENRFIRLGLEAVGDAHTYRQAFDFSSWDLLGPSSMSVAGQALAAGGDYTVMNDSGSAEVSAELVFVGYGLTVPPFEAAQHPGCPLSPAGYDDYQGVDVAGRIAVVLRHGPMENQAVHTGCPANAACVEPPCLWNFGYKAANAALHGAATIILAQDYHHSGEEIIAGTLGAAYYAPQLAALSVKRTTLEAAIPSLQTWAEAIDTTGLPQSHGTSVHASVRVSAALSRSTSTNLLGARPGTDPALAAEVIVVGAHLDHLGVDSETGQVFTGADDNASGTAVMMELARAVTDPGFAPKRTVLFAAWNAEEEGLYGSCHYVESNPVYPLGKTKVAFAVDMVGAGDGSGVEVIGGSQPAYRWLMDVMQGAVTAQGLGVLVQPSGPLDASDHACFAAAGVTGVLVSTLGPHADYHTLRDTIDTISKKDIDTAARVMWATLEPLALGSEASFESAHKPRASAPRDALPSRLLAKRFGIPR